MKRLLLLSALALAGLSACQMPLAFQDPMAVPQSGGWQPQGRFRNPGAPASQPTVHQNAYPASSGAQGAPLLGWDGGVVDGPRQGEVVSVSGAGTHAMEESVDGRMHIIELYQSVLDERDQLQSEVAALQAALETSQAELGAQREDGLTQGTRIEALEQAKSTLMQENKDLAGRLAKAQLRRLEAEKLLLETQIAWHRSQGAAPEARSVANPEQPR